MSRAGLLLALGGALCLLAGSFAVPALYVPGAALVILAVAAPTGVGLAAARTRLSLRLSAESVEEGATVAVALDTRGWPPGLLGGELRATAAGSWMPLRRSGARRVFTFVPSQRGRVGVGPASVRFRDPFAICSRRVSSEAAELLVLPKVERVPVARLERLRGLSAPRSPSAGGMGVDGLRPYRPGVAAARIHWLSVARTGALLERRLEDEDEEQSGPLLLLDTRCSGEQEALDAAVRAAASLCAGLAACGGCSLLLPGERHAREVGPDLASWPDVHARLALAPAGVAPSWDTPAGERLLVWIGAEPPPADVRWGPAELACTVSPIPSRGRPVIFHVAGCAVQPARRTLAAHAA